MTDYSQKFGIAAAVTITLDNLASGSGVDSLAVDNTTDAFIDFDLEINTNGTAGSASFVSFYMLSSIDNTDFTDSANARLIGVVQMNGTTAVKKVFRVYGVPPYYKIRAVNNSGAALAATGHGAVQRGVKYTSI